MEVQSLSSVFQIVEPAELRGGCRPALDSALSVVQGSHAHAETVFASQYETLS